MENQITTEAPSVPADSLPALTIEQFRVLSRPEQRRAIVRDALTQLQQNRYLAEDQNGYFLMDGLRQYEGRELRDLLTIQNYQCTVCGLGACFASAVRLNDEFLVDGGDIVFHTPMGVDGIGKMPSFSEELFEFFDAPQLELIEAAFEVSGEHQTYTCFGDDDVDLEAKARHQDEIDRAIEFGGEHPDPTARLAAILQRIADDGRSGFHP